ncbi:MAG TPA: 3-hydroxyacyl-CoA dehydrogenase NAD-binding domain-containing protein, partial [Cellulomonadaceae bacterium]|nr:3-hydroxyacyl-CoA dehydrogenase NAD-binding domain-containing protein [Cellulomonadaceae bacterium]
MSKSINSVTVVGAGYMGGGIAQSLALAGFTVQIADVDVDASLRGLERLLQEAQDFEDQGLYQPGSTELIRANLSAGKPIEEAVAQADFIEEAVFEVLEVKQSVLATISEHARPDAVIGTNTSTIPVKVLAPSV